MGKYAQYEVVTAATGKKLPFEAVIMGSMVDGIKAGIEKQLWQGFSGAVAGGEGEGLHSIIQNAGSPTTSGYDRTNAWAKLNEAYLKLPTQVLGKDDLVCYASVDFFEHLVLEMIEKNLYHYNPSDENGVINMPGTGIKIIRCEGMDVNEHAAVFARKSNIFYGLDLDDDATDIDLWYSKDNKTFRATAEFVIGVQIAFPDEVSAIEI